MAEGLDLASQRQHPAPSHARLALLGLCAVQAVVATFLLLGWLVAALLLHLGVCAVLFLLPRLDTPRAGWPGAILRVSIAALPALGPLAALAGLCALAFGPPPLDPDPAGGPLPDDPMEARLAAFAAPASPSAAPLPSGLLLEALGDVLRWGTPGQKARVLKVATQPGRRGGDALLCLALLDPDPALRARAEAARPAAARYLLQKIGALHEAARNAESARLRDLARHLDAAAYGGLLEPTRATQCRADAAGLWQSLVEQAPDDSEAQAALGRDLLVLGDLHAARDALEAALACGVATPGVLGWLAECLFRLRDFAALEALIARWRPVLQAEQVEPGALAPAWRLWLASAPSYAS